MRAPFAPPRLSEPRNVDADAHAVETSCETDSPDARILPLSAAMSCVVDQRVIDRGDRVLPDQLFGRNLRAEVARARAHVAVRQLEPRAGERVGELIRVLEEAPRDLLVGRVEPQREVGRQHRRRVTLRRVVGIRHRAGAGAVLRLPLMRAGRALRQLPFVAEQVLEEVVAPLRRRGGPGDLEAAGDRVAALARAEAALSSRSPAPRCRPLRDRAPRATPGRRRGSCRTCGRRRSARRSPRRSSPCARTSRGCPGPPRPDPACRSGLPG